MNRGASIFLLIFFISHLSVSQEVSKNDFQQLLQNVNTRYDEQNPVLSPDGMRLYFTRANDSLNIGGPKDKGDIWYSELDSDGIWGIPVNVGEPINDDVYNSMLGFSPDGTIMFLNKERRMPGGLVTNDGIAYSVYSGESWSKPARVSVDYFLNKSRHQSGSISADGSLMVLSLQAYASRGEEDIYISSYVDGKWSQPKNLGSVINTDSQEMTPYLSPDKKSLYFSSNGHGGKGGRDLFRSEREGEGWTSWSKPKNLGAEINSFGVEMSYFIDMRNEIAYFSSTQNSDGYGDIRVHDISVVIEEIESEAVIFTELVEEAEEARKTMLLSGKVTNGKTGGSISAAINITGTELNLNTNADSATGFSVEVPLNIDSVVVNVKSPGFMSSSQSVSFASGDQNVTFVLTPLEVGTTITLNKVYFTRGTAELLDESFVELGKVVDMMAENPEIKIELSGHTDNQGSSKLNLKLSQDRVEKVKLYLTEHGIESKRIKGKGYGGTRPVASNASETTRKLNRRVEIKILKN